MNCVKCSHPITMNQKFCTSCGYEVKVKNECSSCNQILEPGSKFCTRCGSSVRSNLNSSSFNPNVRQPLYVTTTFASFSKRVLAAIIDSILMFCISLAISIPILLMSPELADVAPILGLIGGLFYRVGMESSSYQGTIGKILLNIKVVGIDNKRISFGRALGRYFASFASVMFLGVGYLFALFTKRKQTLHDLLVETTVINR